MGEPAKNIFESLDFTCRHNSTCSESFKHYLAKQIWNSKDRDDILNCAATLFVKHHCTLDITYTFCTVLLEVLNRAKCKVKTHFDYQNFAIALSKILTIYPDSVRFCCEYFTCKRPFFEEESSSDFVEPVHKKPKHGAPACVKPSQALLLESVHKCVLQPSLCKVLLKNWDWSKIQLFLGDNVDEKSKWFASSTIGVVTGMNEFQFKKFCKKYCGKYNSQFNVIEESSRSEALLLTNSEQPEVSESQKNLSHTIHEIIDDDLSDGILSVCGVLLPKLVLNEQKSDTSKGSLVAVPSTQRNLRSLALAVASGCGVMLQGPVGCGKTTLVEHLAYLLGRDDSKYLMKVQLGDQTDSKALLGTYRCSDVPGEFVWQPGALTIALTEGRWLLLEDIDYAPMDVVSILLPVLENSGLSVPGHGVIKASPGFQIFVTQRLLGNMQGWYKNQSSNCAMLSRLMTTITVEPLSRLELEKVITTKHQNLATICDRLLDIYFMLSAGKHDSVKMDDEDDVGQFVSHDGRLLSTRDLMKWCSRISVDFDVSTSAHVVFQEGLDCFCCCLPKLENRLALATAMAGKLNVLKAKAELYCKHYKPDVKIDVNYLTIGRGSIPRKQSQHATLQRKRMSRFSFTCQACHLLEKVAVSVCNMEPVLLVGETGTGKTSLVQYLSDQCGYKLHVINMNQQSDSTDLLGGYRPVDLRHAVAPVREQFEMAFLEKFSFKQNVKFLGHLQECFAKKQWNHLIKLMEHPTEIALKRYKDDVELHSKWCIIQEKIKHLQLQVKFAESALAFMFMEGTLVKALKAGDWVLLDEINLASAETLECLGGLLESTSGSVVLLERGDTQPIVRHPDFRLFSCMNPATDVGKKDLPPGIRNRFTEIFVDELNDPQDLRILVRDYLQGLALSATQVDGIVKFYFAVREAASQKLLDCTGHRPHYSLRTLCRALRQSATNLYGSIPRSLYEGFCFSFLTQLDRASHPVVEALIVQHIIGRQQTKSILKQPLPEPLVGKYLQFEGYWIGVGGKEPYTPDNYVLTPSVRANLRDICRVVSAGRHPVLLQGETSVGKTSLINWLSQSSGNHCIRINNHEHTDLQEYIGCYAADINGKLNFKEGVLVDAMRKGYWVILDELNLAPTDVLEALNRLLDDNRELFIPETQETVKAHPKFMLFATQNPPGLYGGRKVLSRAFRNRFIELHFDELPSRELETILQQRCQMPLSYCKKLIAVMLDLQALRKSSGVFAGKQGYITLRDLFRWSERYKHATVGKKQKYFDWDQYLADHGYMLLAGRCRNSEEADVIQQVLKKHLKRSVETSHLFSPDSETTSDILTAISKTLPAGFQHVVWTSSMKRLASMVGQALKFGEPVLLVGDTGCGKTTICQIFARHFMQTLYTINCHLHTEGSDFLGGLRPVRHHSSEEECESVKLFEWVDGPLVISMKEGGMLLVDEISLADDSVLERLNSILEPERTLLLAEKGDTGIGIVDGDVEQIIAHEKFRIIATMNPGGDYGKKELSPALRNRFTEIWCPQTRDQMDLLHIIEHNLKPGIHLCNQEDGSSGFGKAMLEFIEWFMNNDFGKRCVVSIRDLLSWVNFINVCSFTITDAEIAMETNANQLDPALSYIHGACMVFIDALTTGRSAAASVNGSAKTASLKFLTNQIKAMTGVEHDVLVPLKVHVNIDTEGHSFSIPPFKIATGPQPQDVNKDYAVKAPTTALNCQRLLRAMQLTRPILLEGSPGVGKTSLVAALARAVGHQLVRINLSDQTDVSDLFGADLPVEGGEGGQFAWRDGPFLQALKEGHWIVLDELNLASQSVLEGLNACLDHRGEIYVPELGMTFNVQRDKTRLFACQNPLNQGGGRKGLPKSFLNRFTQVFIEPLVKEDQLFILKSFYDLPDDLLNKMIDFNSQVYKDTMINCEWGQRGSPWEFNIRDILRWAQTIENNAQNPGQYAGLFYRDRLRTLEDKHKVAEIFKHIFQDESMHKFNGMFHVTPDMVQVGHSFLPRSGGHCARVNGSLQVLHHSLQPLESLMKCIELDIMTILIGPQSCGKTSIVQTLAHLTGHRLQVLPMNSSMDTTELLGGFEQADIGRDMDSVSETILSLVEKFASDSLSSITTSYAQTLLEMKYKYHKLDQIGATGNLADKLVHLNEKVSKLRKMERYLLKCVSSERCSCQSFKNALLSIAESLTSIENRLKKGKGHILGGGQFVWVDSILVEALKSGDWLLIDNVNFCNPSVLDRLNALLEPGGVLSINERGVIDGQIPTIKPHKDFRLILAMDPHRGEISRAMRNRGIEIYILGQEEGGDYDDHDLKAMMHGLGLVGQLPCDILISITNDVRSLSDGVNHISLVDIIHVVTLAVQQLQQGCHLVSSLRSACISVFVKSQRNHAIRQEVRSIIESHLEHFNPSQYETTSMTSSLLCDGLWPMRLPSVRDWATDSNLSSIKKHLIPIQIVVDKLLLTSGYNSKTLDLDLTYNELKKSDFCWPVNFENSAHLLKMLPVVFSMFIEQASFGDLVDRQSILKTFTKSRRMNMGKDKRKTLQYKSICDTIKKGNCLMDELVAISSKHNFSMYYENLKKDIGDVTGHPLDLAFNCLLLKKLLKDSHSSIQDVDLTSLGNKISLLLLLERQKMLIAKDHEGSISELIPQKKGNPKRGSINPGVAGARNDASPLDLSYRFHIGRITSLSKTEKLFVDLYPFFDLLDNELKEMVMTKTPILSQTCHKMMELLRWRWYLIELCLMKSHNYKVLIPELSLHWIWFYNKCFLKLFPDGSVPSKLQSLVQRLQQTLGKDDEASKLHAAVWNKFGHPRAYHSSEVAEISVKLKELTNAVDVYNVSVSGQVVPLVSYLHGSGSAIRELVDRLLQQLSTDNTDGLCEDIKDLESELASHGIIFKSGTGDCKVTAEDSLEVMGLALQPFFEHAGLLMVKHLTCGSIQPNENNHVLDYLLHHSLVSPLHLLSLRLYTQSENIWDYMSSVIVDLVSMHWRSSVTKDMSFWLKCLKEPAVERSSLSTAVEGPGVLQTAPLSYMVMSVLTDTSQEVGTKNINHELEMIVTLGQSEEKHAQLKSIVKQLWSNATLQSDNMIDFRRCDVQLIQTVLGHLLSCLLPVVDESNTSDCNDSQTSNMLIEKILQSQILSTNTNGLLQEIQVALSHVDQCSDGHSNDASLKLYRCGKLWCYVGLLQTMLLAPQGPVDPAQKQAIKLEYCNQEINEIENEMFTRNWVNNLWIGQDIDIEDETLHPRLKHMEKHKVELQERSAVLAERVAVRPVKPQFANLLMDVRQYISTHGSPSKIVDNFVNQFDRKLHDLCNDVNTDTSALVSEEKSWQETVNSFIRKVHNEYPLYADLTSPFLAGISELSYGLRLMSHAVQVKSKHLQWKPQQVYVDEIVLALCQFPNVNSKFPSSLELSVFLASKCLNSAVKQALLPFTSEESDSQISIGLTRLWKQGLLTLRNYVLVSGSLNETVLSTCDQLLHMFVTSWQEMEERRIQKEAELNELYRYKETSHGDGLTEDEREERDLLQNFPIFDQEFADILNVDKLDTEKTVQQKQDAHECALDVDTVSASDMMFVSEMHASIIVPFTQSLWLPKQENTSGKADYLESLLLGYRSACSIVKERLIDIDYGADDKLLGSHLTVLNNLMSTTKEQTQETRNKPYDVYRDQNIAEVVQCQPVLQKLMMRVKELLIEWPDHPALKQIQEVINRILKFAVTSPLMKVVAGLDVLLQKIQDWESNAAKFVSLRSHMDTVSHLLIQYRKYELRCWNSCLDMVAWKIKEKASRWWFHIYQVLHGFIAGTEEWGEEPIKKLVDVLQTFIESSPLGEYHTRLSYLYTFHCHLTSTERLRVSDKSETAKVILWNIHQFYHQFLTNVEKKIISLRRPIEKELKGFVKIARWNDINFWAIKIAAEKTHRTLQKHMKHYEDILNQPVKTLLIDQEDSDKQSIPLLMSKMDDYIVSKISLEAPLPVVDEGSVLSRIPSLHAIMRRHCKTIILQANYGTQIETVDNFSGDIISSVHDLQSAEVNQTAEKEKQKAEAKSLNLRKRKALAELFKYLAKLGLSYRKGLITLQTMMNSDLMTCPILDVESALQTVFKWSCDDGLLLSWSGCQKYFMRCIARRALLHTSLLTPTKELNLTEIEKCKGFSENLLTVCYSERTALQKAVIHFINLRHAVGDVEHMKPNLSKRRLPPQRSLHTHKEKLKKILYQYVEGLHQFQHLLEAVPSSPEGINPYPTSFRSSASSLVKGDELHVELQKQIQEVLSTVIILKQENTEDQSTKILSWRTYTSVKSGFEKLKECIEKLKEIELVFAERTCLKQTLSFMRQSCSKEICEFEIWDDKMQEDKFQSKFSVTDFKEKVEFMVTNVLLVIQHLLKKYPPTSVDQEEQDDWVPDLLSQKLHTNLLKDIELLNLVKISECMNNITDCMADLSENGSSETMNFCADIVYSAQPLFSQYIYFAQYYITQCAATYRTNCKLLSVLLGLFSELIQKGFCLPAEFSDEMQGEGATQFKDIEGGGIGEGEGQKDVSDQIETEDQLEELKKAGEEEKKNDPKQQPDVPDEDNAIEMSDDFEGKMHDLEPSKVDENEDDEDNNDEDEENKLDKQMGDIEDENADKLDEQVWGNDEESEDETDEKKEEKEEFGPGSGPQEESQVVAKDDNKDKTEKDNPDEQDKTKDEHEEKINEQEPMDEDYDENQTDPFHGKDNELPEPESMDLPDDLQLDNNEDNDEDKEENEDENTMDIDKILESHEDENDDDGKDNDEGDEDHNNDDKAEDNKDDKETEEDSCKPEDQLKEEKEEKMDIDESQDPQQKTDSGIEPAEDENVKDVGDEGKDGEDQTEDADNNANQAYGKKKHDEQNAEQSETAQDSAGKTDETEEAEGSGQADADDMLGHEGTSSQQIAQGIDSQQQNRPQKRKPGHADSDRSLGSRDNKIKQLQTIESRLEDNDNDNKSSEELKKESGLYEHIDKASTQYDTQTLDAATSEQLEQQPAAANPDDERAEEPCSEDDEILPHEDEKTKDESTDSKISAMKVKDVKSAEKTTEDAMDVEESQPSVTTEGDKILTMTAARGVSTFHTAIDKLSISTGVLDVEKLRLEIERSLGSWQQLMPCSIDKVHDSEELWFKYEALTSSLSQELCEQLRLILEPSLCTKLRGDYRTGKRLNMRKVIPYIASQFRKDKIWLRRTKPSKRQYQILIAVDDSSSMADSHSKQLAFESLATIANALTLLEAGELAVCSFGESTKLLHQFHEQFTNQSGARLLQQFTFEQKKTKIAQFMNDVTCIMLNARQQQQGPTSKDVVSQLLLIVSDGRGLFLEGMDIVKRAVQQAKDAHLFIVFVILDSPDNKSSILDIKVPIFKGTGVPEIRSYMEHFPYPFYIILRDINSLPQTLADALRQWFELITAFDR